MRRVRGLSSRWDRLSLPEIRRLQISKLRRFLREQVLPFSPRYRDLFEQHRLDPAILKTPEDLRRIPLTQKSDFLPTAEDPSRYRDIILQPTPETIERHASWSKKLGLGWHALRHGKAATRELVGREYRPTSLIFTTGRSSVPVPFALSLYDIEVLKVAGGRMMDVLEVDPAQDRGVSLFPYAPHLAFWQVVFSGLSKGMLILNTGGGKILGSDGILNAFQRIRPTVIMGIPGYCYHLLRKARRAGMDLSFVRLVALGGELVSPALKSRLVELLKAMGAQSPRVVSVLGFTEARCCWTECPAEESTGFHLYPDLNLVEIVNPETGEPLPDGETGELVYTALDGRGSVLVRYRTGDIVQGGLVHEPCPSCGRTVGRLGTDIQRRSNIKTLATSKVKGTLVNLHDLSTMLGSYRAIEEWQIVICKKDDDPFETDEMELYLSLATTASEDQIREQIEREMMMKHELRFNRIEFLPLNEILDRMGMETKLKEERIVDRRPSLQDQSS
ncbi:MAG: AMP-binding protein [Planctomycetota bacterium]